MEKELARPRVLIADDDEGIRDVVERILEVEGFEVVACPDGATALIAAANGTFSLAVIDVAMPHMDGFDVVRHLRAQPRFAQLPIVMLTASGDPNDIVHGFDVGVSDYIVKPFDRGELVARIHRLMVKK